jgi:hypothetical protein
MGGISAKQRTHSKPMYRPKAEGKAVKDASACSPVVRQAGLWVAVSPQTRRCFMSRYSDSHTDAEPQDHPEYHLDAGPHAEAETSQGGVEPHAEADAHTDTDPDTDAEPRTDEALATHTESETADGYSPCQSLRLSRNWRPFPRLNLLDVLTF